jgi:prophage regulatory protein
LRDRWSLNGQNRNVRKRLSMTTPELRSNELVQVLRLPQVCKVTGLCRSMIYQLEAERRFPCRIKLGLRAVGWIEGEVQEWLAVRIDRSRGTASD